MNFISESTFLRSHGMFLYAKLVMENLLAQETRTNLLTEIQSYQFPEGLGEAYERILGRLERSKKAKQWEIVHFDGRRLRSSIEEYCGSLIQILSEDRVELVHTTAKILSSLVSDGYLAFQDYAAAKWLQHIRAIILNSSNQPIHDHESQAALQELGMSLEEFCARYQEDLTGCALAKDIQNDCEAFNGCNYHKDLFMTDPSIASSQTVPSQSSDSHQTKI
ncbi:hypothetical protein M7I_5804 [Glarea lozoyensis 74030]|uniref:Uncharacterized protein n=1 Tax=Glarea lozoyensis (strain ATCC 74030 / MF5533) TaxID=1104152 RepID=H0ESV7_GLAL7|nr:hypothetical protein M7I_5804 [Glarea lozoyensis 74030]